MEILTNQVEAVCLLWSGAIGRGLQSTTPRFVGVPDKQYPRWYQLLLKVTLRLFHQSNRSGEDRLEVRDVPVNLTRSSDMLTSRSHLTYGTTLCSRCLPDRLLSHFDPLVGCVRACAAPAAEFSRTASCWAVVLLVGDILRCRIG